MDRESPRTPADRLEALRRRLEELARELQSGDHGPGRPAPVPLPIPVPVRRPRR